MGVCTLGLMKKAIEIVAEQQAELFSISDSRVLLTCFCDFVNTKAAEPNGDTRQHSHAGARRSYPGGG